MKCKVQEKKIVFPLSLQALNITRVILIAYGSEKNTQRLWTYKPVRAKISSYQTKEEHKEAKKVLDFYLELIVKAVVPFYQSDSEKSCNSY